MERPSWMSDWPSPSVSRDPFPYEPDQNLLHNLALSPAPQTRQVERLDDLNFDAQSEEFVSVPPTASKQDELDPYVAKMRNSLQALQMYTEHLKSTLEDSSTPLADREGEKSVREDEMFQSQFDSYMKDLIAQGSLHYSRYELVDPSSVNDSVQAAKKRSEWARFVMTLDFNFQELVPLEPRRWSRSSLTG
eukprot:762624-Hanusia_phi.AAC.6